MRPKKPTILLKLAPIKLEFTWLEQSPRAKSPQVLDMETAYVNSSVLVQFLPCLVVAQQFFSKT